LPSAVPLNVVPLSAEDRLVKVNTADGQLLSPEVGAQARLPDQLAVLPDPVAVTVPVPSGHRGPICIELPFTPLMMSCAFAEPVIVPEKVIVPAHVPAKAALSGAWLLLLLPHDSQTATSPRITFRIGPSSWKSRTGTLSSERSQG